MLKKMSVGGKVINFTMLGVATGGYNPKYTDTPLTAQRNLEKLGKSFGSPSATLMLPECHSKVVEVTKSMDQVEGDAMFTAEADHALLLRPADCIPLVLYSDHQPLLALVHGSRQGLDESIIEKCIDIFRAHGSLPASLHAYAGPYIHKRSYIVPASVRADLRHASWTGNIAAVSDSHVTIDIGGFTKKELLRLGLQPQNISRSTINIATSNEYYSHYQATRLGRQNGRNGVAVAQASAANK